MTTLFSTRFVISCSLLVALTTSACSRQDDEDAAAVTTSALQTRGEAGLFDAVLDVEGSLAPDPTEAARFVTEHPSRGLQPDGCVQKSQQGNVVTFVLDGCTGAFGKVAVYGTLVATFSKSAEDVLHVALTSQPGTKANDSELTYSAESDIRYEGTTRSYTYRGSTSGVTARGRTYSRDTELTVSIDTQTLCASIDGSSLGSVGQYAIDLSLEGLRGCRDACPTAGRAIATVDGPRVQDASITVLFDGSDQAHVEIQARKKRELSVELDCEAGEAQ